MLSPLEGRFSFDERLLVRSTSIGAWANKGSMLVSCHIIYSPPRTFLRHSSGCYADVKRRCGDLMDAFFPALDCRVFVVCSFGRDVLSTG